MSLREKQLMCLKAIKEIDSLLTANQIWFSLSYGSALGAYREHGFIEWDGDIDILVKRPDQRKVNKILAENLSDDFILVSHLSDSLNGYDEVYIAGVPADDMHIDIYPVIGAPENKDNAYHFMTKSRFIHRVLACKHLDYGRIQSKYKIPFVFILRMLEHLLPDSVLREYFERIKDKYDFHSSRLFFPIGNDGKREEIMEGGLLFNSIRIPFEDTKLPVPKDINRYLILLYGKDYMTPVKYRRSGK